MLVALTAFALMCQAPSQTGSAAQPIIGKHANETDRQVIAALLSGIQNDSTFPIPTDPNKPLIVLHRRNPEPVTPILDQAQLTNDTGGKVLPNDAWIDLVQRNVIRRNPKCREVLYEGLTFDDSIVVANAFTEPPPPIKGPTFEEVYPKARAWIAAWLPGYTKDHKTAVVRAQFGPAKWATVTALLKQSDGKWVITWKRYSVVG